MEKQLSLDELERDVLEAALRLLIGDTVAFDGEGVTAVDDDEMPPMYEIGLQLAIAGEVAERILERLK
jgi:hypothetical protein